METLLPSRPLATLLERLDGTWPPLVARPGETPGDPAVDGEWPTPARPGRARASRHRRRSDGARTIRGPESRDRRSPIRWARRRPTSGSSGRIDWPTASWRSRWSCSATPRPRSGSTTTRSTIRCRWSRSIPGPSSEPPRGRFRLRAAGSDFGSSLEDARFCGRLNSADFRVVSSRPHGPLFVRSVVRPADGQPGIQRRAGALAQRKRGVRSFQTTRLPRCRSSSRSGTT